MNKENNTKKTKPVGNLSLAAGLLKGLNNERAALDQRSEPSEDAPTRSIPPPPTVVTEPTAAHAIPVASNVGNRFPIPLAERISNPYNPRTFYPESKVQ